MHRARRPFPTMFLSAEQHHRYAGKSNPSIWLEDYHLACKVGERTTIYSSSSSSLSVWLNPLEPGRTICRETSSTVGMTYGRSSPATSRAHKYCSRMSSLTQGVARNRNPTHLGRVGRRGCFHVGQHGYGSWWCPGHAHQYHH
jgi:hypothetical protein